MKWIPAFLMTLAAFLAALLGALMASPRYIRDASSGLVPFSLDFLAMTVQLTILITAIGAIALAFLRLAWVERRGEITTSLALGSPRADLIRGARLQGLRLGLKAGIAGTVMGGLIAQFGAGAQQGWEPFTARGLYPLVAVAWAVVIAIVAVATAALYGFAMSSLTRGTPVEANTAAVSDSESPRATSAQGKPRRRTQVLVVVVAFAWGFMVVDRFADFSTTDLGDGAATVWLRNALAVFTFIAAMSVLAFGWFLIRWATAALARPAANALRYGTRGLGARAFAADGLAHHTGLRTGAVMTMSIAVALSTVTVGMYTLGDRTSNTGENLSAPVAVASFPDDMRGPGGATLPSGFEHVALDPAVLESLSTDSRIHVVPFARLRGEPHQVTEEWFDGTEIVGVFQDTYLAVDVAAADAVVPNGYRLLGLADGTLVAGNAGNFSDVAVAPGGHDITVGEVSEPVDTMWGSSHDWVIDLNWAREKFGPAPISGALIYPADDSVDAIRVVNEHVTPGQAYVYSQQDSDGVLVLGLAQLGIMAPIMLGGLIVAVALIVALTTTSQRLRRREYATMAALGASPRSLRTAPAIEAAATATIAIFAGTAAGLGYWLITANPFLVVPGAPLDAGEAAWHLGAHLALFPWGLLAVTALVTVASAAMASLVFGVSMQQRTPVEELRTAMKEGVS